MTSTNKRFLFIRTFKMLKGGGPIPPLGMLYLAAMIRERFGAQFDLKILDTGRQSVDAVKQELKSYQPHYVGLSAMSCEAALMNELAREAKAAVPDTTVIAGGPHSMVGKADILDENFIDIVAVGEAERTIIELLEALESDGELSQVDGLIYRQNGERVTTRPRELIADLDSLPLPAWDLIDFKGYADYPNWNGTLKKDFYAVIATSRGCPFGCYFCHNMFGKKVRTRSADSVFNELKYLYENYHVKEVHFLDDVFNFDADRARRICEMVIDSQIPFAFAFPNGLRADIMKQDLVHLLRKAGTYKINYGFETPTPRLQEMIGKKLDIPKAIATINETAKVGIITGAYFMLGFPTQTREEMLETIDFAANSNLDLAYFFKATPYPGSAFHEAVTNQDQGKKDFSQYHFYSADLSYGDVDAREVNELILLAQRRFYLHSRRLWRGFWKSTKKKAYFRNLMAVFALVVQSYLFKKLAAS